MESADDLPEIPTEVALLHKEVRALITYVKVLSEMQARTHRELRILHGKLKSMGVRLDDDD